MPERLLKMWNRLRPSTQKVLSIADEAKAREKDKEHLRINLHRAEEEVLFEENIVLNEDINKLLRQCHKEKNHLGSGGKHTCSASAKMMEAYRRWSYFTNMAILIPSSLRFIDIFSHFVG